MTAKIITLPFHPTARDALQAVGGDGHAKHSVIGHKTVKGALEIKCSCSEIFKTPATVELVGALRNVGQK